MNFADMRLREREEKKDENIYERSSQRKGLSADSRSYSGEER